MVGQAVRPASYIRRNVDSIDSAEHAKSSVRRLPSWRRKICESEYVSPIRACLSHAVLCYSTKSSHPTRLETLAMGCVSEYDLLEYAEGRLLSAQRAETEAHLRGCDFCRRVVAEIARIPSLESSPSDREVIGRYEVLGPIGAGGMGVVYAARDPQLRRTVALKMLRPGGEGDASQTKMRERLLREARAMAQLSHPNVLPVYDFGELGDDVFVA